MSHSLSINPVSCEGITLFSVCLLCGLVSLCLFGFPLRGLVSLCVGWFSFALAVSFCVGWFPFVHCLHQYGKGLDLQRLAVMFDISGVSFISFVSFVCTGVLEQALRRVKYTDLTVNLIGVYVPCLPQCFIIQASLHAAFPSLYYTITMIECLIKQHELKMEQLQVILLHCVSFSLFWCPSIMDDNVFLLRRGINHVMKRFRVRRGCSPTTKKSDGTETFC